MRPLDRGRRIPIPVDPTSSPESAGDRFEACCCDLGAGDVRRQGKVPTGGELTRFEAVDLVA